MDLSLFKKIIDDAARIGVERIHLYLHGEPMLHPRIVEMVGYVKSRGLAVHMTTNGTVFDRERMEALLRCGVNSADHITFSLLGHSKEVHEMTMQGVDHEGVLKHIFDLLELRTRLGVNGPVIETMFQTMRENEHEQDQYLRFWRGRVDHARLGGNISESFSQYKRGGAEITPRTRTCKLIWERMTVFWNGDVPLCCQDVDGEWLMGNLNERSIQEIWSSERLLSVRRAHREKRFQMLPLCFNCDL
jgi:radical SAM protein with 4Fe4S-binding SPASM domain